MTTTLTPEQADTLPAEANDLNALAQALRNTSGWLAALDYPGIGTAMATCKRAADALGSLARRTAVPSEQEPVAYLIEDSPVRGIRAIVWPGDRELQQAIKKKPQAKTTPLYAHPAPAAGRDAVIEECAKVAENCIVEGHHWRRDIAAAIRALKETR